MWSGIFPFTSGFHRGAITGRLGTEGATEATDDAGVEAREEVAGVPLRAFETAAAVTFFAAAVARGFLTAFGFGFGFERGLVETSGELTLSVTEGAGVDRSEGGGLASSACEIDGRSLTVLTDSLSRSELATHTR